MIIAFVPVRGGSKGIPNKNIKDFYGKPLIYWVLSELQYTEAVDKIVLATDSIDIKKTANSFQFDKVEIYDRTPENADDHASTESVMLEYINAVNLEPSHAIMLVQATSPFTTSNDFKKAIELFEKEENDSVLSCVRIKRFFWDDGGKPSNYDFMNRPRRQDFKGALLENGALYLNSVANVKTHQNRLSGHIGIYEMPEFTAVEIDEPEDWIVAEALMKKFRVSNSSDKSKVKLFVTDVDGVLTDAGMYYSETGDELKKFNTHDGMAFQMLRERGIKTGIVTSEDTNIVKNRALKLKVNHLYQGKKHNGKLESVRDMCMKEGISIDQVAYIGDDINCFELLSAVGHSACPKDAVKKIKCIDGISIMNTNGGEGVVREYVEFLIENDYIA